MAVVGMRVQHDVAKVTVSLLMVERVPFPRQKVDALIQGIAISGDKRPPGTVLAGTSRFVYKLAEIVNRFFRVLE